MRNTIMTPATYFKYWVTIKNEKSGSVWNVELDQDFNFCRVSLNGQRVPKMSFRRQEMLIDAMEQQNDIDELSWDASLGIS